MPNSAEWRVVLDRWGLALILAAYCVLCLEYLRSDLWFDEICTLYEFAAQLRLGDVFKRYRVANNHILFSAVLWCWLRLTAFHFNPIVLRLPSLCFGVAAIIVVYRHVREHFDGRAAFVVACALMFNPVYLSFTTQVRGYSLSILCAACAVCGALDLVSDRCRRGMLMFIPAVLALPAIIPTNLAVNATLVSSIGLAWLLQGKRSGMFALRWCVLAVAGILGMSIYIPIWSQFMAVMTNTAGWGSGLQVALHTDATLLLTSGVVVLSFLAIRRRAKQTHVDSPRELRLFILISTIMALAVINVVGILRAPYPRVFVPLLPVVALFGLFWYPRQLLDDWRRFVTVLFLVLGVGLAGICSSEFLNRRALIQGAVRQNLLQQYYARNRDVSLAASELARPGAVPPKCHVFVDFHFYLGFRHTWMMQGRNENRVGCLHSSAPFRPPHAVQWYARRPQLIVAYSEESARAEYQNTMGVDVVLEEFPSSGALRYFGVVAPVAPENPARNRSRGGNVD